jgi:elongation factor Ts
MEITTELIKALRDETGVSVMQVKKALEESGGDMDKARMALRKKSGEIAAKKGDRTLGAGAIAAYIHAGGTVGAMVELACETDFVAKNEDFKKLAYDIAMHIAAMNPKYNRVEDVGAEDKEKAKAFFVDEVAKTMEGKPEAIKEKALQGKLDAYLKEQTLYEQPFVKDPNITIGNMVSGAVQKFGEKTEITRYTRFAAGK